MIYAFGIGIYLSSEKNYRRREEHGSAKWGKAETIKKKYADKDTIERKKSERCQVALAEKYRATGMTEKQIQEMYEFDLAIYRKERIFYTHTQPLEIRSNEGEEAIGEVLDFMSERTQFENHRDHYNRYWWIDELENLFFTVMSLTDDEKELVTLDYSQ